MKRRSFLAMLGLGSAASTLSQGKSYAAPPINQFVPTYEARDYVEQSAHTVSLDTAGHLKRLKEQLEGMILDKETFVANRMKSMREDGFNVHSGPIPYDLIAMKSFSEETKARLHMRRAAELDYERQKRNILADIEWFTENGNK